VVAVFSIRNAVPTVYVPFLFALVLFAHTSYVALEKRRNELCPGSL
jgi:hypothetical protein